MPTSYTSRNVAVLGLGSSGRAVARLLLGEGARVSVLESAENDALRAEAATLQAEGAQVLLGTEAAEGGFDLGVLSPGIDPQTPLVRHFREANPGAPLLGELEISATLCHAPIVAITGTNGKTTTTQLIDRMFNACGIRSVAAGNIGPALAAKVREAVDVYTVEVSSFQLEAIETFHPSVALWLNFQADHLDRYPDLAAYRAAKLRIFENQTAEDTAIFKLEDALTGLRARTLTFSAYQSGGDLDLRDGVIHFHGKPLLRMAETNLSGLHNAENLMAALAVGVTQGLSFAPMMEALCTYQPLPHRCERVRTLAGVEYINDSKATNLDALEKALLSESRPVVLLAGGKDKGFEYDTLTALVGQKVRTAILIGEMRERIAHSWGEVVRCVEAGSLEEAVALARAEAREGEVVLFSPGTSSFDMFRSYADRGDQFRKLVEAL